MPSPRELGGNCQGAMLRSPEAGIGPSMSKHGAYGERLGRIFHLAKAPAFLINTLRKGKVAVTEIRCDIENNGLTAPIPREDAFLVTLQLRDCPRHELWLDDRPAASGPLKSGSLCIYDLRKNPIAHGISPFHALHFYVQRGALDAIALLEGDSPVDTFDNQPGIGVQDAVLRELGLALLPAFDRPQEANLLFVDHVTLAAMAHVMRAHGVGGRMPRGAARGLAPAQERLAKEIIGASLDGALSIGELAEACGVSIGVLRDGFRCATGLTPHRWLLQYRVERARDLLRDARLSLAEIATACGFGSEAHLVRVFTRATGIAPFAARPGRGAGQARIRRGS